MLVTLKEILEIAEAQKCAVGSFNTPNLESIMAVIGAAEELDTPVIIMHAEVHESMMPIDVIGPIMIERAKQAKVPVQGYTVIVYKTPNSVSCQQITDRKL